MKCVVVCVVCGKSCHPIYGVNKGKIFMSCVIYKNGKE